MTAERDTLAALLDAEQDRWLRHDGPWSDEEVGSIIDRLRAAGVGVAPSPTDEIDAGMQRLDMLRVIELALQSCQPYDRPGTYDPGEVLRNIEEGGYTLRLTTHAERRAKNDRGMSS